MRSLVLLACLFLSTVFTCYSQGTVRDTTFDKWFATVSSQQFLGKPMRAFKAVDLEGKTCQTEDLNNKISFVNFWFEACRPCLAEFGALNELYENYKDRKDFLFISFTFETKENAERITKEHHIKYPVILLSHDTSNWLNFGQGYPLSLIIRKDGKINFISPGGPIDPEWARRKVNDVFKPELELLLDKDR